VPYASIVLVLGGILLGAGLLALGLVLFRPGSQNEEPNDTGRIAMGRGGEAATRDSGRSRTTRPEPAASAVAALADKQKTAVAEAIKALEKVEASTRVGVNISKYQDRVTDALPTVEEAQRVLPKGELKSALTKAMTAYKDAALLWSDMVRAPELSLRTRGLGHKQILDRNGLSEVELLSFTDRTERQVDNRVTLSTIWGAAADAIKTVKAMQ
jgi:hypothetical protein